MVQKIIVILFIKNVVQSYKKVVYLFGNKNLGCWGNQKNIYFYIYINQERIVNKSLYNINNKKKTTVNIFFYCFFVNGIKICLHEKNYL